MKHLVLHLGLHKTGTSYLQLWLYQNRARLESMGILYPDFHMKHPNRNHHWLAKELEAGTNFEALALELDQLPGPHDTVVLSAEHLSSVLGADLERCSAFCKAFASRFRLTLVLYVRRQDEMLESAFAQMVKVRHVGSIEDMLGRPMNWHRKVAMLASVFGRDSIRVRPYHPPAWREAHLGLDFLVTAGLEPSGELEEIARTNESLTRRKTLFMSTLDKSRIPKLADFVEHVRKSPAIHHDKGRWLLSPERRAELVAKYASSNASLVEQYMEGVWGEYFLTPPDDGGTWFPASPITTDEYHDLMKGIWRHAMRQAKTRGTTARPGTVKDT